MSNISHIDRLFGTAFFTAIPGVFITAKHVLQLSSEGEYGLCVKGPNYENLFIQIDSGAIEYAPNNLDIAIGRVNFESKSPIKLVRDSLKFMQNVEVYGYADSAWEIDTFKKACWMDIRGKKGYINREIGTIAKKLVGEEYKVDLSFCVETGISGAPLFVSDQLFHVGGICIGNKAVKKGDNRTKYGVAYMTSSISEWKPSFLNDSEWDQIFV